MAKQTIYIAMGFAHRLEAIMLGCYDTRDGAWACIEDAKDRVCAFEGNWEWEIVELTLNEQADLEEYNRFFPRGYCRQTVTRAQT